MTQAELKILLDKYAAGTLGAEELSRLNQWYLHQARTGQPLHDFAIYEKRMREMDAAFPFEQHKPMVKKVKLWPQSAPNWIRGIAGIAAAVIGIALCVYFFNASRHLDASSLRAQRGNLTDIAPGRNTATLTLASGEVINLDTNKANVIVNASSLSYSDGTSITSSPDFNRDSQLLTASTPRGGTYQVTLPDGTKVWLNADSKISFPSQFFGKERKILLSGEAYFEVATSYTLLRGRRTKQSFVVESRGQTVEVLGTHFNINSYADDGSTKTTLLEGSVAISSLRDRTEESRSNLPGRGPSTERRAATILKPNDQATLSASAQLSVKQINPMYAVSWKNNKFMFDSEPIQQIMKKVARWYNIDVVYEGEMNKERYSGTIGRSENISELLKMLERTNTVKFEIRGKTVIVRNPSL